MHSASQRVVCVLVLSLFAVADSSSAATIAFGPKTYTLESGKPRTFSEAVADDASTSCDGVAAFTLVVQNGDSTGRNGVSSGVITLNGVTLVRENDLNPSSGTITIPIALESANILKVELKGGSPGSSLTISIRKSIEQVARPATTYMLSQRQQSFNDAFLLSDASGAFVLSVQNGTPSGASRVKSGAILVNGQTVVSDKELDRNVGLVTKAITLNASNIVGVDLRGDPGDRLVVTFKREIDRNVCGPEVFFHEPAADSVISTASIHASGTVIGPRGTAVTVNDVIAEVDLSRAGTAADPFLWFAEVPAPAGTVVLRATATDPGGTTGFAERPVIFSPAADTFAFTPSPRSGVAPLAVLFHVAPIDGVEIGLYEVDLNGDGLFESSFVELPESLELTFQEAGQYAPTIRCLTAAGATLTATTHVSVQPFVVMDGMFRAAWSRFMADFATADVEMALRELSPAAQEKYGAPLRTIRADLPAYAASVTAFNAVWISETAAHYLLTRDIEGHSAGYHVYFARGGDGVWRMSQF